MGIEHEAIHLETSSVLFRETPIHLMQAVDTSEHVTRRVIWLDDLDRQRDVTIESYENAWSA